MQPVIKSQGFTLKWWQIHVADIGWRLSKHKGNPRYERAIILKIFCRIHCMFFYCSKIWLEHLTFCRYKSKTIKLTWGKQYRWFSNHYSVQFLNILTIYCNYAYFSLQGCLTGEDMLLLVGCTCSTAALPTSDTWQKDCNLLTNKNGFRTGLPTCHLWKRLLYQCIFLKSIRYYWYGFSLYNHAYLILPVDASGKRKYFFGENSSLFISVEWVGLQAGQCSSQPNEGNCPKSNVAVTEWDIWCHKECCCNCLHCGPI